MFTGLIEDAGRLRGRQIQGKAAKLQVETGLPLTRIAVGDSVAVNGACLTAENIDPAASLVGFHALRETLERTNLGRLEIGAPVNLERALRLGDRLGGHLVLGHIDATAAIRKVGREDDDLVLRVELPKALRPLLIDKGSIAIDGISLTVAELTDDWFGVHIIPHTWRKTTLQAAAAGQLVNLEADMVGKYILRSRHLAAPPQKPLDMEFLNQSGF